MPHWLGYIGHSFFVFKFQSCQSAFVASGSSDDPVGLSRSLDVNTILTHISFVPTEYGGTQFHIVPCPLFRGALRGSVPLEWCGEGTHSNRTCEMYIDILSSLGKHCRSSGALDTLIGLLAYWAWLELHNYTYIFHQSKSSLSLVLHQSSSFIQ